MNRYVISIVFLFTIGCIPQQGKAINTNEPMQQSSFVIKETAEYVEYLRGISRFNDLRYGVAPEDTDGSFYLQFGTSSHEKKKKKPELISTASYMMLVTPSGDGYKTKLQMGSHTFYENGKNVGHAHPSGQWYEDEKLSKIILDYYFSHESEIPVHLSQTDVKEQIDLSRWKPLFALSQNESNQQHVLKLTKNEELSDSISGWFALDCVLLGFNNVLVNNELMNYSISTHTLSFVPVGGQLHVRLKHHTTRTYTNGGKDFVDLDVPDRLEELRPANEILFSRKVLEYYFAHKEEVDNYHKN